MTTATWITAIHNERMKLDRLWLLQINAIFYYHKIIELTGKVNIISIHHSKFITKISTVLTWNHTCAKFDITNQSWNTSIFVYRCFFLLRQQILGKRVPHFRSAHDVVFIIKTIWQFADSTVWLICYWRYVRDNFAVNRNISHFEWKI